VDRGRRRWIPGRTLSRRRWLILGALAALVAIGGSGVVLLNREPTIHVTNQFVLGTAEADRKPVPIDTTLYLPAHTPDPAVLLAHGLGGTKRDLDAQARGLARRGYVVLAYTARGFGSSGGLIHLDSVKYEVADAAKLIDFLQARPEVLTRNGQPVVGVAGSSYGGALALILGSTDHRIGAVAADITWNDLGRSLLPNAANVNGAVFKKLWAGYLFSAAEGLPGMAHGPPGCGRFAADLCLLYQRIARGELTDAFGQQIDTSLLLGSSPATFLQGMRAPTLLTQGEQDSQFTLREADSNAKQIAAAGAQVRVRWRSGGHDAPNEPDDVAGWQRAFFDRQLRGKQSGSTEQFQLNQRGAAISSTNGRRIDTFLKADGGYPDVNGHKTWQRRTLALHGKEQTMNAPAGGTPAAVSSIPALGDLLNTGASLGLDSVNSLSQLPGQTAVFTTDPLSESTLIVGSPRVALGFTSQTDITAFVSVRDLGPDGSSTMPTRLVSPIHVASDGQPALGRVPRMFGCGVG